MTLIASTFMQIVLNIIMKMQFSAQYFGNILNYVKMCNIPVFCQKYLIKVNFKDLSLLPNGLKVEPLDKPKTGLKFFVNTTKPKTKVSTLSLSPG